MIERDFDVAFVADLALREKRIQQNYRPVIAVHKWFARRPGTLFRSLLLSEFSSIPLREAFYQSNSLDGLRVADPFMGGGTPLLEANRLSCDVLGYDINPMAYWIVRQEIASLDLQAYRAAASRLRTSLESRVGHLYRTRCRFCGADDAHMKYALWVKLAECEQCGKELLLFPGYLVAAAQRHPMNVFVCPECGELSETHDRHRPGCCSSCGASLARAPVARANQYTCPSCGGHGTYQRPADGPPKHRLFALEYHCARCKPGHAGRFFKRPDEHDYAKVKEAKREWQSITPKFAPDDTVPSGDETDRLHRWGYRRYDQMFNYRQLLGLELSCDLVSEVQEDAVRCALATNLSDLVRYQNMLCRYDTTALKSLDIFSVHGFPVGLVQCESNLLGIEGPPGGMGIGSGGWTNIIDKYVKAKAYCERPFEVKHAAGRKTRVFISEEWIGERRGTASGAGRRVELHCQDAATVDLPAGSVDAVLTDPPYLGNVQYAELMDFCYAWLRRLIAADEPAFVPATTRSASELTANDNMGRGIQHFTDGLSAAFRAMATALKPGGPFVFTYHHNRIDAYLPIVVGLLDAGLICTASLPCPGEMGASIHINGTNSSIVDSVFVCRSAMHVDPRTSAEHSETLQDSVEHDLALLRQGGVKPTAGDARCIAFGHLARMAVAALAADWDPQADTGRKLELVADWVTTAGGTGTLADALGRAANSVESAAESIAP